MVENVAINFYKAVKLPEVRAFYAFQIAMEHVHIEVYSQLIDTFVKDQAEKECLFNGIETIISGVRIDPFRS